MIHDFDAAWNYAKPADTEHKFLSLLEEQKSAAGPAYLGELYTQLARTQSLQSKWENCIHYLKEAERYLEEPIVRIRYLLERGRMLNSSGRADESIPLFLQACKLADQEQQEFYAIDAIHMLGIADVNGSLDWNLQAIERIENCSDPRSKSWLGSLLNNTAWSYHNMQQYEQALNFFLRAQDYFAAFPNSMQFHIAEWSVARCLRSLGRINEALAIQERLGKQLADDAYVFEELGELYLILDKPELSRANFASAYTLMSQDEWIRNNEPLRLARILELSGN